MLKLVQAFVKLIQELVIVFILNMIEEDYHPEQKKNRWVLEYLRGCLTYVICVMIRY